jgi:hypothetical protein
MDRFTLPFSIFSFSQLKKKVPPPRKKVPPPRNLGPPTLCQMWSEPDSLYPSLFRPMPLSLFNFFGYKSNVWKVFRQWYVTCFSSPSWPSSKRLEKQANLGVSEDEDAGAAAAVESVQTPPQRSLSPSRFKDFRKKSKDSTPFILNFRKNSKDCSGGSGGACGTSGNDHASPRRSRSTGGSERGHQEQDR